MAWHDNGCKPINSTITPPIGAGSTSTIYALLDSTMLGSKDFAVGQSRLYQVTYIMGADTNVTWQVGVAANSSLDAGVDEFFPKTPTGQSAQFLVQHTVERNQIIRVRQASSGANGAAYISAVPLT
jgi:hypothetical protein